MGRKLTQLQYDRLKCLGKYIIFYIYNILWIDNKRLTVPFQYFKLHGIKKKKAFTCYYA